MRSGTRVGGRFEIEREAGAGGMGVVYRARDLETGAPVALKFLHPDGDPARFAREADLLAALDHPGIVRYVAHASLPDGRAFLAMEWLEGEDLAERLERERLTIAEGVTLIRRVSEALGAAHARGIVHRDVKPSNLLLQRRALERVRVIDFGLASGGWDGGRRTRTGAVMGTPGYMAPEQVRGERAVDARADVFALGCVLHECLTGAPLFAGNHPVAILAKILIDDAPRPGDLVPGVPPELDDLAARMVAKAPGERPADAREVAAALAAIEGGADAAPETIRRPKPALTAAEVRFVSLVVVGLALPEGDGDALADEPTVGLDPLVGVARALDARLELLVDGSVVIVVPDAGVATDQAARAAECALRVRTVSPSAQVAVATGRAEVGGALPVGDVIDRAVRLSHVERAPLGRPAVRVDDVTAALLDARFERGADAESALLFGLGEDADTRTLLARPTPCVGRDAELATLDAVLDKCVGEGVAQVVVVTAPAGMGKSRLLHEFLRRLAARAAPVEVWRARGDALGVGSAFGLIGGALRRSARVLDGEPRSARQRRLKAHVGRHVRTGDVPRVTTFLGELVGAPFSADDVALRAARCDPALMGQQIRRAWTDLLDAECATHPVLLVLEDLQWGDRPSIELVDLSLRELAERPLMVLGLARPEIDEAFPGLWKARDAHRMSVGALSRRAAERIVRSALGEAAGDTLVGRIVERAGGNAFCLEELVRAASEGHVDAAPETVVAMVQGRLERFDPGVRRLLRAASVYGQVFWEGALVALLGAEARFADVRRELERLVAAEVVTRHRESRFAGEVEYAFRHALLREGAYAMLTETDRALGHGLAASWLEAAGASDALAIAEHCALGGERARAVAAYARAAEQALEGRDLDAVIARAEQGAALGASGELLGALRGAQAEAHLLRGDNPDTELRAEEAVRLLPPATRAWAEAVGCLATAATRTGKKERIEDRVDDVFARVVASGAARAVARLAVSLLQGGRRDVAGDLLDAAERTIGGGDTFERAWLLHARSTEALHAGRLADGVERAIASVIAFDEIGDQASASTKRVTAGFLLIQLGAYADAETTLRQALSVAERIGLRSVAAQARQNVGWVLVPLGRLDEARQVQLSAIEVLLEQGNRRMEGGSRTYLAAALLAAGDVAGAEREARSATVLLGGAPPARAHALAVFSRALLRRGRVAAALAVAREASAILASTSLEEGESLVRLVHAEALDAAGEKAAARDAIRAARDRLLARAAEIEKPRWRASFLEAVPEHVETLRIASAWLA